MHLFTYFFVFIFGISRFTNACFPNTFCTKDRDTIIQKNSAVSALERAENRSRLWYIQPDQTPFDGMLAFKNFSSQFATVVVVSYNSNSQPSSRYFQGDLEDFELILQDCIAVVVYFQSTQVSSVDFVLKYYTGCTILSSAQDEINHISLRNHLDHQSQCWLIYPTDNDDRKRIYFSVRDVYLPKGQQIDIWDLHTSNLIMQTNSEDYRLIAAESQDLQYHQSIVIDYKCTGERCNEDYHSFFITYYTMTQADSSCIEIQKTCTDLNITGGPCNLNCPALNNMILEEFSLQAHQPFIPIVRSGSLNREQSQSPHAEVEKNCVLPKQFCSCPASVRKEQFCSSRTKCIKAGRCAFACIYHKITTCIRIRLLQTIQSTILL